MISETGEVAVDGQRERARDRRRRHVEDVRAAPLGERGALLDAEAVLLVDDGDGEVAEADLLLDQRVRADRDLHVARGDQLAHVRVLLRAERAREQRDAHAELRADALDREEVLLGEHLGRRHQRALPAGLDGAQQRRERDDGLAGADVALQQPLHRRRPREVAVDLGDRPLLRVGERERQHLAVARRGARRPAAAPRRRAAPARPSGARVRAGARGARRRRAAAGPPPPPRASAGGAARRARRRAAAAARTTASAAGSASPSARASASAAADERAQLLLRERLARRVDRRVVGRLGRLAEVVALDLEAVAVGLPAQADARAGRQLRLEPRLVEPGRPDLARVVGDPRA